MSTTQGQPAGWYPDPDTGGTRYWDGRRWTGDIRPRRRSFAAAAAHRGLGIGVTIGGALLLLGSPSQFAVRQTVDSDGELVTSGGPGAFATVLVIGLGLVVWGIYLLRGQGPTTKAVAAKAQAANDFESALAVLRTEVERSRMPRAALVTAYLVAQAAGGRRFGPQAASELPGAYAAIGFDPQLVVAPLVGQIPGLVVYRDWLVVGTQAYDLSGATRAAFHLDERGQTVTTSTQKGSKVVSTSVEQPRGGQLQVVGEGWAQTLRVDPAYVPTARTLAENVNIRAEQLKTVATDAAAHRSNVEIEQIRAIANPETAQALQNLQNLLFTRVISDEEFAQMKAKLLSGPTPTN